MDSYTRNLLANALRNPQNEKVYKDLNGDSANGLSMSSSSPFVQDNPLSTQRGIDAGYLGVDLNNRQFSMQKNGSLGSGNYHAEITKPFDGDAYGKLQYVLPHRNGYLDITGSISPQDKSLFANYKTNF